MVRVFCLDLAAPDTRYDTPAMSLFHKIFSRASVHLMSTGDHNKEALHDSVADLGGGRPPPPFSLTISFHFIIGSHTTTCLTWMDGDPPLAIYEFPECVIIRETPTYLGGNSLSSIGHYIYIGSRYSNGTASITADTKPITTHWHLIERTPGPYY